MNPKFKEMTEALGMMLQIGGMSRDEIIAWIDDLIEKTENPPEWVIELSRRPCKEFCVNGFLG